jgi:antitoxin MazE
MAEVILYIEKWGNYLGVRLPVSVAREAQLHVDQQERISVEGAQVVIIPIEDSQFSLKQRLAIYDPSRHGGEQMVTAHTLGPERR